MKVAVIAEIQRSVSSLLVSSVLTDTNTYVNCHRPAIRNEIPSEQSDASLLVWTDAASDSNHASTHRQWNASRCPPSILVTFLPCLVQCKKRPDRRSAMAACTLAGWPVHSEQQLHDAYTA